MAQKIIVDIPEDGPIEISVEGTPGPSCEQLTKEIEESLGTVRNRKKTGEYYHRAVAKQSEQVKQK